MTTLLPYTHTQATPGYRRVRNATKFIPPDAVQSGMIVDSEYQRGTSPLTVLHLRTVAANASCGRNIARILQAVNAVEPIELVVADGATGWLDTSLLDPNLDVDALSETGELTGVEQFLIRVNGSVSAYGVEDPSLYREMVGTQEGIRSRLAAITPFVERLRRLETLLASEQRGSAGADPSVPFPLANPVEWCRLILRILSLQCTMDNWEAARPWVEEFAPGDFLERLTAARPELAAIVPTPDPAVLEAFPIGARFYELAVRRGEVFAENALRIVAERNVSWVVSCITGFQEKPFVGRMKAEHASIITMSPQIQLSEQEPGNLFQSRFNRAMRAGGAPGDPGGIDMEQLRRMAAQMAEGMQKSGAGAEDGEAADPRALAAKLLESMKAQLAAREPAPTSDRDQALQHYQRGIERANAGDARAALEEFDEAARLLEGNGSASDRARIAELRAQMHERLDEPDRALDALREAEAFFDDGPDVSLLLATAELTRRHGEPDAVRELLRRVEPMIEQLDDRNAAIAYAGRVANVYEMMHDWNDCCRAFCLAHDMIEPDTDRNAEAMYDNNAGLAALLDGQIVRAVNLTRRAVGLERAMLADDENQAANLANALCNHARTLIVAGRFEEAEACLDEVVEMGEDAAAVVQLKLARYHSRLLAAHGDSTAALPHAERAVELSGAVQSGPSASEDDAGWLARLREETNGGD